MSLKQRQQWKAFGNALVTSIVVVLATWLASWEADLTFHQALIVLIPMLGAALINLFRDHPLPPIFDVDEDVTPTVN